MQDKSVTKLTDQDAALLEQGASMLEGLESDERNRGNCSTAEGAACSAHAVRRLASALLAHERAPSQCLHQIQEPAPSHQPVSGQSRFTGQKWEPCAAEHVAMVLATPHEWQGYEVRYLYAAPAEGSVSNAAFQTAPAAVAVPDALIADARRLAYVADQIRALEPEGSESDVYLKEAAHVFRACADRITALAATPAADAPVVLPEPDFYCIPCFGQSLAGYVEIDTSMQGYYSEPQLRALLATATGLPAQADARDARQERWMDIGKAIERACIDQPESTEIVISLERDAGTVTMFDPDGNEHDQFSHEDGLAGVVNEAIDAAIAAVKGV